MVFALWVSLVGMSLVISLTPGAGAINTMSNALAVGWKRAFWGIIGQQLGIFTHILIAAVGIGVLITSSPVAFAVVRYLGAGYLIFIGLKQFFARPSRATAQDPHGANRVTEDRAAESVGAGAGSGSTGGVQVLSPVTATVATTAAPIEDPEIISAGSLVRRGFWVNLLNPKAVVFFLAIMPQFISAELPAMPQYLFIAVTMTIIDMTVMFFVYAAAAEQFRRFTGSPRGQVVTNRIFGALFVVIALLMLLLN